jgi:ribokinase
MGLNVAAGLRVGMEGTGDLLVAELKAHGIADPYIERDPVLHTGMSFIVNVRNDDHVLFHYPGAAGNLALPDLGAVDTEWIYLTSLTGPATGLLAAVGDLAQRTAAKLVFNPGETQLVAGYQAISGLIKRSHVLILNRREAIELARSASEDMISIEVPDLLALMAGWGPRYIVITDGDAGSYAADGSTVFRQPGYPARTVDTTGAGDAFGSAFAAGLIHYHGDIAGALRLGAANAASIVSRDGAHTGALNLADAEALAARYPNVKTERIG